jgi:hypothetical protein
MCKVVYNRKKWFGYEMGDILDERTTSDR